MFDALINAESGTILLQMLADYGLLVLVLITLRAVFTFVIFRAGALACALLQQIYQMLCRRNANVC